MTDERIRALRLTEDQRKAVKAALGCKESTRCPHMSMSHSDYNSERYRCDRCGDSYSLYYDEMR
jgi:hypothetical protein